MNFSLAPIYRFPRRYIFQESKPAELNWNTFAKGLNTLLNDNEIRPDELAQATDLVLIGRGIPTKRWGTSLYYTAGNATGSVRGLKGFYKADGTNELLAVTDDGYLTKQNGASFTRINGVSFASGNDVTMAQLNNTMYISNGQRALAKYSSPTLVGFTALLPPTILSATNLSNASGTTDKAYRVSIIGTVGETLASSEFILSKQPADLSSAAGGILRLTFTAASTSSVNIAGYNIYGRDSGEERFIASLPAVVTTFDDDGTAIPREFTFVPTADTTAGPIAGDVVRHEDRLIFTRLSGEGSKVLISGRAPFNERFDVGSGGNFIQVEPDSGDDVTKVISFRDRIIVLKQRSIWQVILGETQIGNFFVTEPSLQLITQSYGCIAPKSVVAVENDVYFLSREGVNTLGYQANFVADQLRTSAISTKVRPFFDSLTTAQKKSAVATYFNKKYIITFPGLNQSMVFDIERAAWMGPWSTDGRVFEIYTDSSSNQHLLFGDDSDVNVQEYSDTFSTDNGVAITTSLKTRREDFNNWAAFKNFQNMFFEFKNTSGNANIDIRIENRDGSVTSANSFSISALPTGNSGWGADLWGSALWGSSNVKGSVTDTQQLIRWRQLQKIGRTIQVGITTMGANDTYQLLGIRGEAQVLDSGYRQTKWKTG